jgi:fumarate reductase subunit C
MPQYSQFQPKPYERPMSPFWYFDRWPYLKFILRESSSFFVAYFAVVILIHICAISSGPSSYAAFSAWMRTPTMITVNLIAFVFVVFHTVTWFMLVPRVMVRQVMGRSLPEMAAAAPNYAVWAVLSIVVALFALRVI